MTDHRPELNYNRMDKSTSKLQQKPSPKTRGSAGAAARSKTSVKSTRSSTKQQQVATSPKVIGGEPIGNTVYQFKVRSLTSENELSMERYAGNVLLVVNSASNDRLLSGRNIIELNRLHLNYESRGLRILAFPSNDFGSEPLTDDQIKEWISNQAIQFEVMAKVQVNGTNALPLFVWLKEKKGGFMFIDAIKYNFTKFLVDRHGVPFARYSPLCDFETIERELKALLL